MSEIQGLLQENIWYIYGAFLATFILFAFITWIKSRWKIKARVYRPIGIQTFLKKPELDGQTIIMRKSKGRNDVGWTFKFDQTYPTGRIFKTATVDVIPNAARAVHYDYEHKTFDAAYWDRKTEEDIMNANVVKAAGAISNKLQIPAVLYVMILASIVIGIIGILVSSGRVRIG